MTSIGSRYDTNLMKHIDIDAWAHGLLYDTNLAKLGFQQIYAHGMTNLMKHIVIDSWAYGMIVAHFMTLT